LQGGEITPWLAASYQFSSDAKTLTFHLQPNVQWSDGQPFSSDDVVFTLNMLKQYPVLDTNGIGNYLTSVTAPDSSTVTVTLKQPYSPILWYVGGQTYIVPKHIWSTIGDPSKYAAPSPVGTGSFTFKSFSEQLIDLVKNPKYWQASKLQITEIRFQSFKDLNSMQLALARGTVDWAQIYVPGIQQVFVQRDSAHNHTFYPPNNIVFLDLNLAKPPFNQLAVRQAISLAIDRDQIEKVGESNIATVASPTGLVLPNDQKYLAPAYANTTFTVDTNKANQLLQSAGFTKGSDGIYADKTGKKLSFKVTFTTGIPDKNNLYANGTPLVAPDNVVVLLHLQPVG
jgi:peptide/nickel transport system substrate-binding protein